jgi:hypothetical protein
MPAGIDQGVHPLISSSHAAGQSHVQASLWQHGQIAREHEQHGDDNASQGLQSSRTMALPSSAVY